MVAALPLKAPTAPRKCAPVQMEMSHRSVSPESSSENVRMSSKRPLPPSEESSTASIAYCAAPGWSKISNSAGFDLLCSSSENDVSLGHSRSRWGGLPRFQRGRSVEKLGRRYQQVQTYSFYQTQVNITYVGHRARQLKSCSTLTSITRSVRKRCRKLGGDVRSHGRPCLDGLGMFVVHAFLNPEVVRKHLCLRDGKYPPAK